MRSYVESIKLVDRWTAQILGTVGLWDPLTPPMTVAERSGVALVEGQPRATSALAAAIGVRVVAREMSVDGTLTMDAFGPVAHVNGRQDEGRMAFSVAHELAHWLLLSSDWDGVLRREVEEAFVDEERRCDAIAAGLLMPREWVWSQMAGRDRNLRTIQRLAGAAGVSFSAAVLRLHHVSRWRPAMVHLTKLGSRWAVDSDAGFPPGVRGRLWATQVTEELLNQHTRAWLPQRDVSLKSVSEPFYAKGDVLITGQSAAILFRSLPPALTSCTSDRRSARRAPAYAASGSH